MALSPSLGVPTGPPHIGPRSLDSCRLASAPRRGWPWLALLGLPLGFRLDFLILGLGFGLGFRLDLVGFGLISVGFGLLLGLAWLWFGFGWIWLEFGFHLLGFWLDLV